MNKYNDINPTLLKHTNSIITPFSEKKFIKGKEISGLYIAALLGEVNSLGYSFSFEIIERLRFTSKKDLKSFHRTVISLLKSTIGADISYTPLYPGFPDNLPDISLIVDSYSVSLYSYVADNLGSDYSDWLLLPASSIPLDTSALLPLKIISLSDSQGPGILFNQLLSSSVPISSSSQLDIEILSNFLLEDISKYLPSKIKVKENLGVFSSIILNHNLPSEILIKQIHSSTDILRIATYFSGGDISLKKNTLFKSFSNKIRRLFMSLLEEISNPLEDMYIYRERWLRISERIHPNTFQSKFPIAVEYFKVLKNNPKSIKTFNSKVELSIQMNNISNAVGILSTRPGIFLRRLDHIIRLSNNESTISDILSSLKLSIENIDRKLLFQALSHFKNRNAFNTRAFVPKGEISKLCIIENNLPSIPQETINSIINILESEIINQYSLLPALGKVYLDPELSNFKVPFNHRGNSNSLLSLTRGTSISLGQANIFRFFTSWIENKESSVVDLDISALALSEGFDIQSIISYSSRAGEGQSAYSGDIRSAAEGANEFIDIDRNSYLSVGTRYIALAINSYNGQPFSSFQSFAGIMIRDSLKSGEVYEPLTVKDKFDLYGDTSFIVPLILDLKDNKLIWTDLSISAGPGDNAQSKSFLISQISKFAVEQMSSTLSIYDLFSYHIQARTGTFKNKSFVSSSIVSNSNFDNVFSIENGLSPFNLSEILADWI